LSALVAVSLVSAPGAALAQQPSCLDNLSRRPGAYPPPDLYASATWDRLPNNADPAILRLLVGTWYTENKAPQLNMVQKIYSTFEANGLFQYRDQTCGSVPGVPCSQNQGTGSFRAVNNNDRIFVMTNFSDLNRWNQCVSDDVTFPDPTTMVGRSGAVSRKVQ